MVTDIPNQYRVGYAINYVKIHFKNILKFDRIVRFVSDFHENVFKPKQLSSAFELFWNSVYIFSHLIRIISTKK